MTTEPEDRSISSAWADALPRAPDAVLERAASCVRFVLATLKIELDFTPETLSLVDHWLGTAREAADDTIEPLIVEAAGAYFGEVVRRALPGARWHVAPKAVEWRIELDHVFLSFNPIGVAIEAPIVLFSMKAFVRGRMILVDSEAPPVTPTLVPRPSATDTAAGDRSEAASSELFLPGTAVGATRVSSCGTPRFSCDTTPPPGD